ncbi:hypothetical protein [Staphylococcus argenteus]|uniref:hypothetical protein n=1 Tax=Staphylococcus argenteus TaxID=985002 RepID=UPI001FBC0F77|nr:hypothetical protein [Staphylococcus argenteus]GJF99808.1 hypothetical protein SASC253_26060 [Staphylococcus argenteus]GJG15743.1 hypothetical protein SASC262_26110 [Staphylococcus argenteus]GJG18383.1 hypothetical protein SASC264_26080 [Staphylococcus argenteus]
MTESKVKDFTIDEKEYLVSSLIGMQRNTDEGVELLVVLLQSLSKFVNDYRTLELNQSEIMEISYVYDDISNELSSIFQMLLDIFNLIFSSDNLRETKERLQAKFLLDEDISYLINQIELFENINKNNKVILRQNYLKICDSK